MALHLEERILLLVGGAAARIVVVAVEGEARVDLEIRLALRIAERQDHRQSEAIGPAVGAEVEQAVAVVVADRHVDAAVGVELKGRLVLHELRQGERRSADEPDLEGEVGVAEARLADGAGDRAATGARDIDLGTEVGPHRHDPDLGEAVADGEAALVDREQDVRVDIGIEAQDALRKVGVHLHVEPGRERRRWFPPERGSALPARRPAPGHRAGRAAPRRARRQPR